MDKYALGYSNVSVLKFVYDFNTDDYELTTSPQYYYDRPHHSDLLSELYETVGEPLWEHETVEAYLLLEDGDNALDYEELPAMTFACLSDPIPTIINAFAAEGYKGKNWYNARTHVMSHLSKVSGSLYDDEEEEEDPIDYETVPTMKFVYDENNDVFQPGPEPQTYYDHPHHGELMEELANHTGNWDMEGLHSGYLYLGHSPDNAITYGNHPTHPGMVMTTIPPHQSIVDHFRKAGYPITHWYEKNRNGTVLHEIPQELPKPKTTHRKVSEVGNFSLIKFVSLPDKFLIGENTHHAYLLQAEFGSKAFPSDTAAIGRAWLENGKIHGVGFDFGNTSSQEMAIHQLGNWARDHGYDYSPNMEHIIGLASAAPDDKTVAPITRIEEVAKSIKHCGDYGQCYWNPNDGTIFWNMGDADGPPEYDSQDEIEQKFLAIPEVEKVEFGDEQGPPGGWYQLANVPRAFVYANGHMFYGIDHGIIVDENNIEADALYGRLHERSDGRFTLELYSDYDPNQTKEQLHEALPILKKRYNIADITENSLIPASDMAEAEQYFA